MGLLKNCEEAARASGFSLTSYVKHCISANVETVLVDYVTILRTYTQERQSNGGFRVRAGFVDVDNKPIYTHSSNWWSDGEPIARFQPVITEFDPLSPIAELLPQVNDLALDLINQGGIQDLTVIAQPNESHWD